MSDKTGIEWTDHTFNPWWGCTRVSPGCVHCYADTFAKRYGHDLWHTKGPRRLFGDKHWAEPLKWNRKAETAGVRARVFCASMADVFEDHPDVGEARARLWGLVEETPWLDWQVLTKRPENILDMTPWQDGGWPGNLWTGTSVEDQRRADERIPILVRVPGVRFLSCEPLLGPVDLGRWTRPHADYCQDENGEPPWCGCGRDLDGYLDWVIVGGESGPGARPMQPAWARSLRDQCTAAGVPFLFKQWGEYSPVGLLMDDAPRRVGKKAAGRELDGRTWDEYPTAVSA